MREQHVVLLEGTLGVTIKLFDVSFGWSVGHERAEDMWDFSGITEKDYFEEIEWGCSLKNIDKQVSSTFFSKNECKIVISKPESLLELIAIPTPFLPHIFFDFESSFVKNSYSVILVKGELLANLHDLNGFDHLPKIAKICC